MAADNFSSGRANESWRSAAHAEIITPNDSTDLTNYSRGVSWIVQGAIKVTTVGGETLVIPSGQLVVGVVHPVEWKRIWSTGTTATGFMVFW